MSIEFTCAQCGKPYRVKDELAGKTAKCTCGAQVKIPALKPEPAGLANDDFSHLTEPDAPPIAGPKQARPPKASQSQPTLSASTTRPEPSPGKLLEITGSPWLKIIIGAAVGGAAALWGMRRMRGDEAVDPSMAPLFVIAFSGMGAVAATLLVLADAVRKRVRTGKRVPIIAKLLFASGILSLVLWIVVTFIGAIAFAFIDSQRFQ